MGIQCWFGHRWRSDPEMVDGKPIQVCLFETSLRWAWWELYDVALGAVVDHPIVQVINIIHPPTGDMVWSYLFHWTNMAFVTVDPPDCDW